MEKSCEPEAHISSQSDYVRFVKNVAFTCNPNRSGKYDIWVRDKLVYPAIEPDFRKLIKMTLENPVKQ